MPAGALELLVASTRPLHYRQMDNRINEDAALPKGDQLVIVRKHGTVHIVRRDVVASKTASFGQGLEQAGDIGGLVEGLAEIELIHHAIDASLGQSVR